ncbi:MAG: DNA-directed RNA polymerase subunit F [Nanoarchaeota archaeon]|nr:DNA-directed RNA polymerase subunit F [Nanoarchaeota archaeon]
MIKNTKALNLAEIKEILEKFPQLEENNAAANTLEYIKKFSKMKYEKAEALKDAIRGLNNEKLKEKHIAKIVDLMPEDAEDLRKIFIGEDFSLEMEEINSILEKLKVR